ncbi:nuclear GTPase SLIP-GC-like [Genypterus blacodes]|uniref:nuclear GTPase SLIP-GC-like n=1 Tax=Genypterus blacodes TaxID=154954 RepID=UPI003F76825D
MDNFVCRNLTEWGFGDLIVKFKEKKIDTESLLALGVKEIKDLIPRGRVRKFKKNLKELKVQFQACKPRGQSQQEHQIYFDHFQLLHSGSTASNPGKRTSAQPGPSHLPPKRQCNSTVETIAEHSKTMSEVMKIMSSVCDTLELQDETTLNGFLKNKIDDLKTDKRKLIGVFGRSGAGKSSLINAVLGEQGLLPTGRGKACTTVMTKVEANMCDEYEANIEFIIKEEWEDELWSYYRHKDDQRNDDVSEKLQALYAEEPANREKAMEKRHFREIPEFLTSETKVITCHSAAAISEALKAYTRRSKVGGKQYWPLVKCVTLKLPNNDFLKHVTLVDLPGSGDRNKSRDEMWRGLVESCSTVWIVSDMERAADDKEAWNILNSTISLMGNGGECERILFIATKSDRAIDNAEQMGKDEACAVILQANEDAKEDILKAFAQEDKLKSNFSDFQVFTVSSDEFFTEKHLSKNDTEIPKLQQFLQNLNDHHSKTCNYVTGAYGILSLMLGAGRAGMSGKRAEVYTALEGKLRDQLDTVRKAIEEACTAFKTCLSEGVTTSEKSCERIVDDFLNKNRDNSSFHRSLKSIVKNGGACKPPEKNPELNLNGKLCEHMFESIDEQFKKTFPNNAKHGPFDDVIADLSLDTKSLTEKYQDVQLQLTFLTTEEEKLKAKVISIIREEKKTIYACLAKAIMESMKECYEAAARCKGTGSLQKMKNGIIMHVCSSKTHMFRDTKDVMMGKLNELKERILKTLEEELRKSMELSLRTDDDSIPDVIKEYERVKLYHHNLSRSVLATFEFK